MQMPMTRRKSGANGRPYDTLSAQEIRNLLSVGTVDGRLRTMPPGEYEGERTAILAALLKEKS